MFFRKYALLLLCLSMPMLSQADYICTGYCLTTAPRYNPNARLLSVSDYTFISIVGKQGSGHTIEAAMNEVKRKCGAGRPPIHSGMTYDNGNRRYMTEIRDFDESNCEARISELNQDKSNFLNDNADEELRSFL